jgi:hypothetical protein
LAPAGQDEPRVAGGLDWRRPGQRSQQLSNPKWAGKERPVRVGRQVLAAVFGVEQHEQLAAVVAADLRTGNASILCGHVDHNHIGRQATLGELERRTDHLQLVFLGEQEAQVDAQPPTPAK